MNRLIILVLLFQTLACSKKKDVQTLVTNDLAFFEKYAPECERWMEANHPCEKSDCFTSAALEIVGVDTFRTDTQYVYAWCWVQQFKMMDSLPTGSKGKYTPAKFMVTPSGRAYPVAAAFFPDPEKPLKDQLVEQEFPDVLIKTYYINQPNEVEIERARVLSEKAKDKYRMYLENAYVPEAKGEE